MLASKLALQMQTKQIKQTAKAKTNKQTTEQEHGSKIWCSRKGPRGKQALPLELTEQPLSCACFPLVTMCGVGTNVESFFSPDQRLGCLCSSCELQLTSSQRGTRAYGVSSPHQNRASSRSVVELLARESLVFAGPEQGFDWTVWKGLVSEVCCQFLPSWKAQCGDGDIPPGPEHSPRLLRLRSCDAD